TPEEPAFDREAVLPGGSAPSRTREEVREETQTAADEVLWVVSEKWEQEWYLPGDRRDPHGLFALSVLQEMQDYGWTLRFTGRDDLPMDNNGNISTQQAATLASRLGVPWVVVGTVSFRQRQSQETQLETSLRLVDASSGKIRGEVSKRLGMAEYSNQEGAMGLASMIVPQLDRLLDQETAVGGHESRRAEEEVQRGGEQRPARGRGTSERGLAARDSGEWVLRLRLDHQFGYWTELEKALRERFKSMQVKSFDMGPVESVVRLTGLDGPSLSSLNGVELPGGVRVQVSGEGERVFVVSFTRSERPKSGPVQ
ncbi:MAG: hypothetical protein ACLGPL_11065, partial [Acidobacteriota bacterium]